jgi:nitric oxide reductase subunit B
VVWTGVSIIMLLAGICAMVWWYAAETKHPEGPPPEQDPLGAWQATPSQRATLKYFWVVAALILVQITLGVVTAHYGVEGDGFYGIPLSQWLPYSVARTWHVQCGLFWIATAWLAAGLFIGPLVSGVEPPYQRLGVNILFLALLVVVAGSLTGQWLSVKNFLSDPTSFYLGHQGYEYVDLGRVWQIGLMVGLLLWLFLMIHVLLPALRKTGETRQLVALLAVATGAIALFYGAGLTWGQHTHLSMVEYWRWWVVHLWVEGFFEVFATTVIAFFFYRLGLLRPEFARGRCSRRQSSWRRIIGTRSSPSPRPQRAGLGSPALEVSHSRSLRAMTTALARSSPWVARYRWPIYFFVAVSFWNMVGAGLFGFMINPPIALYYMQGLNTTPVHGHAALFGVYGMLGIGLTLVCLRALVPNLVWNERLLWFSFWAMNVGLFAMCVISLLPVGLLQTWASVDQGYWYARSSEFMNTPLMQTLRGCACRAIRVCPALSPW